VTITEILLVDSTRLFRDALTHLLAESALKLVHDVTDFQGALARLQTDPPPRLVLLDSYEQGVPDVEKIERVRRSMPSSKVVVLAQDLNFAKLVQALGAGADGYLLKDMSAEGFIQSLSLVLTGEKVFPSQIAQLLVDGALDELRASSQQTASGLSPREIQILRLLIAGEPNKVIAGHLDIAEATVKVHLKAILRKIKAANRTQAAIWAVGHGICQLSNSLRSAESG
jgi:two-component system, NarL family, nitrate/nitrite response regulator NarL